MGRATTSGRSSGPRGHPGTVTVIVSNANWSSTATYFGTEGNNGSLTGDGDPPKPCVPKK